ncbi:MAG: aspartate aminotransferase family protein [Actinomycetota bacterium]|nr:aspartate aminotransferase family protein [Actinomycetota bacterium]
MTQNFNTEQLSEKAKRHLWMHFTRMSAYNDSEVPVMVRGEGGYVWDSRGKRYIDGLAGLFVVQAGHGRTELAEAAARQSSELAYFPLWSYAHVPAIELAERLADLTPGDLNRVFFTTGGGEANETAMKLARQFFKLTGKPKKTKFISRNISYHGTTMGALSVTGLAGIKGDFEPLIPGTFKVANNNRYRCVDCAGFSTCNLHCADDIERMIQYEGADTVAAVFLEPVQNAGGCFVPPDGYFQRVREICDKYDVLLIADEVICGFGRLGEYFGSIKYNFVPDMMTVAKGMSSGYAPIGALIVSDRIIEPYLKESNTFLHGFTFAGHPVSSAVALANLDIFEKEDIIGNVQANQDYFREKLEGLRDIPIIGDVRGTGYFYGLELVKDRDTKETFNDEESERLLRGLLTPHLFEAGLICRADDRGDPVIQLSPPLTIGRSEIDDIVDILRTVVSEAAALL